MRVSACGVCRTDLHVIEGELLAQEVSPDSWPPGSRDCARARAKGRKVWRSGTRVGVPWVHRTCGRCEFCARGRENLCESALFNGYTIDGGYADYLLSDQSFTFPIPDSFPDLQAVPLLCAGVIGYRALRLAECSSGRQVRVYTDLGGRPT